MAAKAAPPPKPSVVLPVTVGILAFLAFVIVARR